MPYPHLAECGHSTHGVTCGLYETATCFQCAKIVAAKSAGRDDMYNILSTDPSMEVQLAAMNALNACIYVMPELM
jgi:hypothetical protein